MLQAKKLTRYFLEKLAPLNQTTDASKTLFTRFWVGYTTFMFQNCIQPCMERLVLTWALGLWSDLHHNYSTLAMHIILVYVF